MKLVLVAAVVASVASGGGAQGTTGSAGLQRLLDAELARFPGKAAVYVKHLGTGEEAAVRADEMMNTASVIKIPVLALAMRMVDAGQLNLAERITIRAEDMRGGTGVYRLFDPGLQPTLRDVLMQMIITSDNTATDLAIAKVGGVPRVNAWLTEAGYASTMKLHYTIGHIFAKRDSLPPNVNRNEKTIGDPNYWLGSVTPRAMGKMLEAIQRCSDGTATGTVIASKASCAEMMRMMRAQQAGVRRLPHFISVPIAHKTGDFPPVLANDVGIIFTRSGPVVVAFFSNDIKVLYAEAEDRIGEVGRLIVEYFDGVRQP
jgi:beta-lactamase class A